MNRNHVFHGGPKNTIFTTPRRGVSVVWFIIFRLVITRSVVEKWMKKSENH